MVTTFVILIGIPRDSNCRQIPPLASVMREMKRKRVTRRVARKSLAFNARCTRRWSPLVIPAERTQIFRGRRSGRSHHRNATTTGEKEQLGRM
jgi:hypothetical protein